MFGSGFLGTNAPMYMDIITLYFAILPILMGSAIYMAMKKRIELHKKMQVSIFMITMIIVLLFEVGVRFSDGFTVFMKYSSADYTYMIMFLIAHIFVAVVSVILYFILIYSTYRQSKLFNKRISHKKLGHIVYFGMSITSISGVFIYYYLFIY